MEERDNHIAILSMLTHVGHLDGEIDEAEKLLVRALAVKLGVDEETTEKIIRGELRAEIKPPKQEFERIPYFQMCIMASAVNGDFNEEETLYCKRIGMKLGLRDTVLDKAIALFKKYYPQPVPVDVLKKTFQINHN